jgi:HSP20 family protein
MLFANKHLMMRRRRCRRGRSTQAGALRAKLSVVLEKGEDMNLTPRHSRGAGPLDLFRREMDTMFQRFFGEPGDGGALTSAGHGWTPHVDVADRDKELVVKADLPGVKPEDVDVRVEDGVLTLRGERHEEKQANENEYHRVERFVGRFYREIPLPSGADLDHIQANSAHGVLTITIPKKPEVQPRRIPIKGHPGQAEPAAQPGTAEAAVNAAQPQGNKTNPAPQKKG